MKYLKRLFLVAMMVLALTFLRFIVNNIFNFDLTELLASFFIAWLSIFIADKYIKLEEYSEK